jgi:hypothetical protein
MKRGLSICGFLFIIAEIGLNAQNIPSGVKMGMSYDQIRPLMTGGEWQSRQGNIYVFFQSSPPGMYGFGIDDKK